MNYTDSSDDEPEAPVIKRSNGQMPRIASEPHIHASPKVLIPLFIHLFNFNFVLYCIVLYCIVLYCILCIQIVLMQISTGTTNEDPQLQPAETTRHLTNRTATTQY